MIKRFLAMLVARNYKERFWGRSKDEWYWADYLLLQLGYTVYMKCYSNMKYDIVAIAGERE